MNGQQLLRGSYGNWAPPEPRRT